ncbi:MAG: HD-GYP domain-containing protein [Bacillota bacterium]
MIIKNPNIVLVDDDDIITDSISTYFELATDFKVTTYNNPKTAIAELDGKKVDVIISDFMMPEMNGLDFLSNMKKICPDAVMILLTGYADKENAIRAINELELFQYVEKPWDNEELVMIVKNGLEKKNLILELTEKINELSHAYGTIENQKNEISHLYELLKKDYQNEIESVENVIVALAKTIEAKDKYTEGHTDRVSHIAEKIGKKLKLPEASLKILRIGGVVHDIGKIAVPESILNKPGRLTTEEFDIVKEHPVIGEKICRPLKSLNYVLASVRQHHEKLNGTGYPDQLKGDAITLESRIIAVADIYDAITTDRPYRPKMTDKEALEVLEHEKKSGNLDPLIVDTLIALINEGEIL